MALNIGELYATVTADTGKAQKSLNEFGKKLSAKGESMKKFGGSLTKNITAPIAGVALGVLAGIKSFGNYADSLLDLQSQTGITTDNLQRLRQVEKDAGITQDTLANSALELSKGLISVSGGAGKSAQILKEMGIETTKSNGEFKAGDVLQQEAIKTLAGMTDKTKRNAFAQKLFGGQYKDMLVVIDGGAEAFDASIKKADELGGVISGPTLKAANEARKSFNDMGTAIQSKLFAALGELMPLFQDTLVPLFMDKVIPAITGIITKVGEVVTWFTSLDGSTQKMIGIMILLLAALGPIVTIVGTLATVIGFLMSPIGLVVLAIVAVIAIGVLLYKNWDLIKVKASEFGTAIKDKFNEIRAAIAAAITKAVTAVTTKFQEMYNGVTTKIQSIKDRTSEIFNGIRTAISNAIAGAVDAVSTKFQDMYTKVVNKVTSIKDRVSEIFTSIKTSITDRIDEAKEKVKNIIDTIKGYFTGLKLKIPSISLPRLPKLQVTGEFGINPPSIPKFRFMAKGGFVKRPTFAALAERGAEAVVPLTGSPADKFAGAFLSRLKGLGGGSLSGGNGITINIQGDVKDPAAFAKMISREIQKETERKTRARGR